MATILDEITIGNILYLTVDSNPGSNTGTIAPVGSIAIDSTTGIVYSKTGSGNTAWSIALNVATGNTIINYINIGTQGNSGTPYLSFNATAYTAVNDFVFNPNNHVLSGSTVTFVFNAVSTTTKADTSANIRLFNITTNAAVPNSTISIPLNSNTAENINSSATISLSDFNVSSPNIFETQIQRSAGSGNILLYSVQLKIINTF